MLFSCAPNLSIAQSKDKPKVAVVLSGGGAKGIAHLPLLKKLDSLGIVPDLVVGTSIGSLVGGFYAMGYSADSITAITRRANWDNLLGGRSALKDISVEEKSEFGKYMLTFDFKKGKLKTKSALLNDQHLREFFNLYTYPVHNITNFDKFPIAYRAVATDIVNGNEVILKEGSLAVAMRSSMSIPSIFKPVPYKDLLLVDGGILNNFPVDIAKKWGADIIIGSDVGGGMKSKEELEDISSILFQSAMLVSNKKNSKSKKMCDILVDHVPNLTYSTADFKHHKQIYKEGIIGSNAVLPELIDLSKLLNKYEQKKISIPIVDNTITLNEVVFNGISENNLDLVKSRVDLEPNKPYTIHDIIDAIHRGMGTTLFSQLTTKTTENNGLLGLEITGFENSNHQIKTSAHYDNTRGVGLIVNYTGRNFLGNSSRVLITGDITQQPAFRVQYQKLLGEKKSWWLRSEVLGEFLIPTGKRLS